MMKFNNLFLISSLALGSISAVAQTTQRTPLYETFTSSTCPPCTPANIHLEDLFSQPTNAGKFTSLKYQMSWPGTGDPYYTLEGNSRRGVYGINSVPRLELDGGFDSGPTGLTQSMMNDAYDVPAIVELEAFYQVNEATQTVDIQVSAKALQAIESSGGFFLHVAIFEYKTTNNVKSNGETEFEHVMKKMVPNAGGTYVGAMAADETRSFDLTYTFNGDYILPPNATAPVDHSTRHTVEEFSDLGVVVWLQRTSTREVYQSAYAKSGTSGIQKDELSGINEFTIYPNPTQDFTRIIFSTSVEAGDANVMITDYAGKVVYETVVKSNTTGRSVIELDTKDFDNGMYIVTITTKEGRKSKKLSVIH